MKLKVEPFYSNVEVQRVKGEALKWKRQEIFCVGCCGMWFCLTQKPKDAKKNKKFFDFYHNCFAESAEDGMIYFIAKPTSL
ncbi:hypothetical protein [Nostoc cycadae]|uniref:hypothetical protein n=1 Tax=Nostoc cycadae TaxID=246795 RepID=UPI000CCBECCD|nr:hypothetical protein [Nostoc cycadae]